MRIYLYIVYARELLLDRLGDVFFERYDLCRDPFPSLLIPIFAFYAVIVFSNKKLLFNTYGNILIERYSALGFAKQVVSQNQS